MNKCEYCEGTGFYGDNGPGIKGNQEYHVCDQCKSNAIYCNCRYWARDDMTVEESFGPLMHHPRCSEVPE
jgi:hypothetical protein